MKPASLSRTEKLLPPVPTLREVPRGYLSWMAREGVATDRGGGLDDALRCLGYDVAEPVSERQRRPVDLDDDVPF